MADLLKVWDTIERSVKGNKRYMVKFNAMVGIDAKDEDDAVRKVKRMVNDLNRLAVKSPTVISLTPKTKLEVMELPF